MAAALRWLAIMPASNNTPLMADAIADLPTTSESNEKAGPDGPGS